MDILYLKKKAIGKAVKKYQKKHKLKNTLVKAARKNLMKLCLL